MPTKVLILCIVVNLFYTFQEKELLIRTDFVVETVMLEIVLRQTARESSGFALKDGLAYNYVLCQHGLQKSVLTSGLSAQGNLTLIKRMRKTCNDKPDAAGRYFYKNRILLEIVDILERHSLIQDGQWSYLEISPPSKMPAPDCFISLLRKSKDRLLEVEKRV